MGGRASSPPCFQRSALGQKARLRLRLKAHFKTLYKRRVLKRDADRLRGKPLKAGPARRGRAHRRNQSAGAHRVDQGLGGHEASCGGKALNVEAVGRRACAR